MPVKNLRVKWINVDLIFFPIISTYVEKVSHFCKFLYTKVLVRQSKAKMEEKLLKGGSEIDERFGNFSKHQTIYLRGEEIERILAFYETRSLRKG